MTRIKNVENEDDVFDENGLLRDGQLWRIPLHMMDSIRRVVDGRFVGQPDVTAADGVLHRPGFARATHNVADRERLYFDYDAQVSTAWKNPTGIGGRNAIGSRERAPGSGLDPQSPSRAEMTDARKAAYDAYDRDIANAWRGAVG